MLETNNKVIIPLIRKALPNIIASRIIGAEQASDIWTNQNIRIRMEKGHYKNFLRINDRSKTQPLRVFKEAGYPCIDLSAQVAEPWFAPAGFNRGKISVTMEAIRWCREQFGEHGYQRLHLKFVFKDEADAAMFKMRWG